MSSIETSALPPTTTVRWASIIQLILSILAAVLLLGAALIVVLVNILQLVTPGTGKSDPTQSFMVAASLAFTGILVLPSAWYSWKSISQPESVPVQGSERRGFGLVLTIVVFVFVPGALLLGNWVSQHNTLSWFLLPPLNIIVTGLPALWLVYLGTHGLPLGSPKRRWGVFASGLVLGPLIIIILELLVLVGMGIIALLWAMVDPSLSSQMGNLIIRLRNSSSNPEVILRILLPFILNPGILFIIFSFIAIIVPMIEELLKPLGVWFLGGQKLTPAHGFVYGVISGVGFAIFENLGNTSDGGQAWALLASSRISTLLLHCFTAGLVGWALVSAWSQRRYLRLGLSYILAVIVHGLWNGMVVLSAASSLQGVANIPIPANLQRIGPISSTGIIILGALVLVLYVGFNAVLRRNMPGNEIPPQVVDIQPSHTELSSTPPFEPNEGPLNGEIGTQDQTRGGNPTN